MKPRNENEKLTEGQSHRKKPRFKIDKLEERLAPRHTKFHYPGSGNCHTNPHGKVVGCK